MRIWAIGDLHLGIAVDKPMDVFGSRWRNHAERIARNWEAVVAPEDVVLVPGDISWGLRLAEAVPDLAFIAALPGTKVLSKGNHDPWWSSRRKVEAVLPAGMFLVQHDARALGDGVAVTGTRGWSMPGAPDWDDERDPKVLNREVGRLELGLAALERLAPSRRIVMLHYPPILRDLRDTPFTRLLSAAGVEVCLYGHLHGEDHVAAFEGEHDGVRYRLVACDHIDFRPVEVLA